MSDNPAPRNPRGDPPDDLWDNPMGTDGFEFVEYTGPDPQQLAALFEQMGFVAAARHRSKNVTLYKQGDVNFILNAEPESFAQAFARLHGPSVCAIAFRVKDAAASYDRAIRLGASSRFFAIRADAPTGSPCGIGRLPRHWYVHRSRRRGKGAGAVLRR